MAGPKAKAPDAGDRSIGRDVLAAVLLAGCLWLMWMAAATGLRSFVSPELGVKLQPNSPTALLAAAEAADVRGEPDLAASLARRALNTAPVSARGLRILGRAVATQNEDLADPIMTIAGALSLRDSPTEAWLMSRRLKQGRYAEAVAHADMLLRVRPDLYEAVFPVLDLFAGDGSAVALLAQRMALTPVWREAYLYHLAGTPAFAPAQVGLADALQATGAPLTAKERAIPYGWLVSQARFDELRSLRTRLEGAQAPLVVDGEFPAEGRPYPLGWALSQAPGFDVQMASDPLETSETSVLALRHDGFRPGVAVRQLLLLGPGRYRMQVDVAWISNPPPEPPSWRVTCVASGAVIASLSSGAASGAWRSVGVEFEVPDACPAQEISLVAVAGERRTDVDVAFDSFRVLPR